MAYCYLCGDKVGVDGHLVPGGKVVCRWCASLEAADTDPWADRMRNEDPEDEA